MQQVGFDSLWISLCVFDGNIKCKAKIQPRTGHEGPDEEQMYRSTLPSASGGQSHTPAAINAGKPRYPLYKRLGGPQGQTGRVRKISPPPEFDPRTVQPLASRYTD